MSVEREKRYVTVSLPVGIVKAIDALMEELGYWPSRGAFVREACLEKIWSERKKIRELMNDEDLHVNPSEVKGLTGGLARGSAPVKRLAKAMHESSPKMVER